MNFDFSAPEVRFFEELRRSLDQFAKGRDLETMESGLAGRGYRRGNPAERAYRCAKYAQIAGTSTEIARVKLEDMALLGYL